MSTMRANALHTIWWSNLRCGDWARSYLCHTLINTTEITSGPCARGHNTSIMCVRAYTLTTILLFCMNRIHHFPDDCLMRPDALIDWNCRRPVWPHVGEVDHIRRPIRTRTNFFALVNDCARYYTDILNGRFAGGLLCHFNCFRADHRQTENMQMRQMSPHQNLNYTNSDANSDPND